MKPTSGTCWRIGAMAASLTLVGLGATAAVADEAAAREILKKMTDYLASQQTLSFNFDTNLQVVTADEQKLDIASSGSVAVARPDKFHARRQGGFASVEAIYDGKTLTVMNADKNVYGQEEFSGSIDDMIGLLRDKYQRPLPAADLLSSDAGAALIAEVTDVKDLGSGVIRGQECDHLAFRAPEVDWQIWVSQGPVAYPCRFSISSKSLPGSPSYSIEFSAWGAGSEAADFAFLAPQDATKVEAKDVPDLDDLSGIYVVKGAN